jgi:hypothetical protein
MHIVRTSCMYILFHFFEIGKKKNKTRQEKKSMILSMFIFNQNKLVSLDFETNADAIIAVINKMENVSKKKKYFFSFFSFCNFLFLFPVVSDKRRIEASNRLQRFFSF